MVSYHLQRALWWLEELGLMAEHPGQQQWCADLLDNLNSGLSRVHKSGLYAEAIMDDTADTGIDQNHGFAATLDDVATESTSRG